MGMDLIGAWGRRRAKHNQKRLYEILKEFTANHIFKNLKCVCV